jgi:hypothetical protein
MAESRDKKILRIGLIQSGKIVEERLLRRRESVTIGQSPRNTFIVSGLAKSYTLFDLKSNTYHLNFRAGMNGKVSVGDSVYDFKSLREQKQARKRGDGYIVELSEKSRGKVVFGDVVILFQFVTPPPPPSKLQLPASLKGNIAQRLDWPYLTALMASFVLQVFSLGFIVSKDYPAAPMSFDSLPDEFIQMLLPEKKKLPVPVPKKDDDKKEKEDEKSKEKILKPKKKKLVVKTQQPKVLKKTTDPVAQARNKAKRMRENSRKLNESTILKFITTKGDGPGLLAKLKDGTPDTAMNEAFIGTTVAVSNNPDAVRDGRIGNTRNKIAGIDKGDLKTGPRTKVRAKVKERAVKGTVSVKAAKDSYGDGDCNPGKIAKKVKAYSGAIRSCYEKQLKRNNELRGRVEMQIEILPTGRVGRVDFNANTTGDRAITACMKSKAKRWRFPKFGGSCTVTFPFSFSPAR